MNSVPRPRVASRPCLARSRHRRREPDCARAVALACAALCALSSACGAGHDPQPAENSAALGPASAADAGAAASSDADGASPGPVISCTPRQTLCNGVCVNLQTNRWNCGACGHGCQGGACSAAVCQPFALTSGHDLGALAVGGKSVYFGDYYYQGSLSEVSIHGGSAALVGDSSGDVVTTIAVASGNVYWGELNDYGGAVATTPVGGGAVTTLASSQSPSSIVVTGSTVYWSDQAMAAILSVPVGGGAVSEVVPGVAANSIAVHAGVLYWTEQTGYVKKLAGSGPVTLASGLSYPFSIHVDSSGIYFLDAGTSGSVLKMPLAGGTPTPMASGQYYPRALTGDGTNLYWTAGSASGQVLEMPVGGGAITTLAYGQPDPGMNAIAVDDTSVYWVDNPGTVTGTAVMKVAKD